MSPAPVIAEDIFASEKFEKMLQLVCHGTIARKVDGAELDERSSAQAVEPGRRTSKQRLQVRPGKRCELGGCVQPV